MSYRLQLDVFEGPFDLLLYLIKKSEINIYDIPIAKILEEFLEYVEVIKELDLDTAGEFILVGATLVHIKSKLLLPKDSLGLEDGEEEDPRAELVRRLLEYKRFKEAAHTLDAREEHQRQMFWRRGAGEGEQISRQAAEEETVLEFQEVNLFDLLTAFKRVLAYAKPEIFHEVNPEEIKTSQKVNEILDRLEEDSQLDFSEYMGVQGSRLAMISAFLAILELARLKAITIFQDIRFDRIVIKRLDEFTAPAREAILGIEG